MARTEIPAPVRRLVLARADGRCERCGAEGVHLELHHRRYRSRGGAHTASNLVALCGWGNHTGCHGWAHSDALAPAWGLSVASWGDPAAVPFWCPWRASWQLPDDGGGWAELADVS